MTDETLKIPSANIDGNMMPNYFYGETRRRGIWMTTGNKMNDDAMQCDAMRGERREVDSRKKSI